MTGRQRHRLVVKEQPGETVRLPLRLPTILKPQGADDPQITGMEPDNAPIFV
jgi:hypothetical protein